MKTPPNLNLLWSKLLVEECVRLGVDTFFISPGSRSTALTLAVAEHPKARSVVHPDERGIGFAAVGYGREARRPAAVISTSGSAVAHLFPAVCEASQSCVPMLVLTADRPPELRDTAANQAMDQVKIFGSYARWQFDMPCPSMDLSPRTVLTTVDQAVFRATNAPAGPVHLNLMFRDPLSTARDGNDVKRALGEVADWLRRGRPFTTYSATKLSPGQDGSDVVEALQRSRRPLLVVGELSGKIERRAVASFARKTGWPVVADVTSGLGVADVPTLVEHADLVFLSDRVSKALRPDAVLHVGGRLVSKRIFQGLEEACPDVSIVWNENPARQDPAHILTHRSQVTIAPALANLASRLRAKPAKGWTDAWRASGRTVAGVLTAELDAMDGITEPGVARLVTAVCGSTIPLHVGSSMPVRDADMYADRSAATCVSSSRGVSGIDGVFATAFGRSVAAGKRVAALTGDLAALHDLNSLLLWTSSPSPLTGVVVNNDGGGIFSFLPVAGVGSPFERYWGTPHGRSFASAAEMFGLSYARPGSIKALREALVASLRGSSSTLIEVTVNRAENLAFHRRLNEKIRRALDRR